eukprot:scaffold7496_cov38-Tisochrysis_lutea.AAC.1
MRAIFLRVHHSLSFGNGDLLAPSAINNAPSNLTISAPHGRLANSSSSFIPERFGSVALRVPVGARAIFPPRAELARIHVTVRISIHPMAIFKPGLILSLIAVKA